MPKRTSRYVRVAALAYALAQATLPRYAHPKSPHTFTLPQRVACVLMMFYLNLSYRDMEDWLGASDQVCATLELHDAIPDHSTLQRTFKWLRRQHLEAFQTAFLDAVGVDEELIAGDSTGFRYAHASAYYQTRRGQPYREWLKGAYAVGTHSQFILGWHSERGPRPDAGLLNRLRRQATPYGHREQNQRAWHFIGDTGFDGRQARADDLIPVRRKARQRISPPRRARAELVAAARLDGFYGQRWKCETVHSVIKRKLGDTVCSRGRRLQMREPLVKGLVYNLHR